jgi:hypothetical protein
MSEVIISARDAQKISQISSQLPHALLVIADYGLDGLGVAQILAKNNDTFHLKPLPEKQTISIDQIRQQYRFLAVRKVFDELSPQPSTHQKVRPLRASVVRLVY